MEDSHYSPSEIIQEKIEKRDVRFAAILISLGGLTFFIIGSIAAGLVVFKGLNDYLKRCDNPLACMFEAKVETPEPRLQNTPAQDLIRFKGEQKKVVDSYEILDPSAGIARVPVSRAMELLAENPERMRKKAEPKIETVPEKGALPS